MPGDPPLASDPEGLASGQAEAAAPQGATDTSGTNQQPVPAARHRGRVRHRGLKQFAAATAMVAAAFAISYGLSRGGDDPAAFDLPQATTSSATSSPATSTTGAVVATGPTGALAKPKRLHWHAVKSAMCVRLPDDPNGVQYLTVVDCRAAHQVEVLGRAVISGPKKWPGDDAIYASALDKCRKAFETYVGLGYDESRLDLDFLTADVKGWNAGDHTLVCLVFDPEHATITKALRGTAQ